MFQLRASLAGVNLTESEVEELTNKGVGTITKVKYKTSSPKEALKCISHPWEIMTDRRIDQSTDQQTNMRVYREDKLHKFFVLTSAKSLWI